MKFAAFLTGLALLVPAMCLAQSEPAWVPFVSKQGHFKVSFPATPKQLDRTEEKNGKQIHEHLFMCANERKALFVMYLDIPYMPLTKEQIRDALDQAAQVGAARAKADLVAQQDFQFGPYPGKSLLMKQPNGATMQAYVIIAGKRAYAVMAGAKDGETDSPFFKKFFDSFRITG